VADGAAPGPGGRNLRQAEAGLEAVELGPQQGGQLLAELAEPLGDRRHLSAPIIFVDAQALFELFAGEVETFDVE
jgi:hypothetical protein